MRAKRCPGRRRAALTILLAATGLAVGLVPASAASAATCQAWTGTQPPNPGTGGTALTSVAVLSSCNAWAVGFAGGTAQTLIEHWDGSAWKVVPSPNPGTTLNILNGVRAVSANDIWAVGQLRNGLGNDQTLILHWNGVTWKQVTSPNPGTSFSLLEGVRAVSAHDVWAAGYYSDGNGKRTLILRWNGNAWQQVPSPNPRHDNVLTAVAATSASNAWTVGFTDLLDKTLILHWNGTRWSRMASPSPGPSNLLTGIGATSATNAWAVGTTDNGSERVPLILHWNGHGWTRSPTPAVGAATLTGVTVTSASNAWAVGALLGASSHTALILHWNGRSWSRVGAPGLGASSDYFAVAATSATNAWAVGGYSNQGGPGLTLAAHCC